MQIYFACEDKSLKNLLGTSPKFVTATFLFASKFFFSFK